MRTDAGVRSSEREKFQGTPLFFGGVPFQFRRSFCDGKE